VLTIIPTCLFHHNLLPADPSRCFNLLPIITRLCLALHMRWSMTLTTSNTSHNYLQLRNVAITSHIAPHYSPLLAKQSLSLLNSSSRSPALLLSYDLLRFPLLSSSKEPSFYSKSVLLSTLPPLPLPFFTALYSTVLLFHLALCFTSTITIKKFAIFISNL